MNKFIFPITLIILDLGAALMYGIDGDIRKNYLLDRGRYFKYLYNFLKKERNLKKMNKYYIATLKDGTVIDFNKKCNKVDYALEHPFPTLVFVNSYYKYGEHNNELLGLIPTDNIKAVIVNEV